MNNTLNNSLRLAAGISLIVGLGACNKPPAEPTPMPNTASEPSAMPPPTPSPSMPSQPVPGDPSIPDSPSDIPPPAPTVEQREQSK